MNINELANKTLKYHINMDSGAGELIQYLHTDIGQLREVRCYPQDILKEDTSQGAIVNYIDFHGLELEFEPKKNDKITYNNIEWRVNTIASAVNGLHDIRADEVKHNIRR